MKKAKIMLTAITVLAVVGGALAFKAKTLTNLNLFVTDGDHCLLLDGNYKIGSGDQTAIGTLTVDETTTVCSQTTSYELE